MIVVGDAGGLLLVNQPDHAHLASELLSLWRAGGMPEHPRRGELLFAVREHDNGWREIDAAPPVDPATGRPYSFIGLPAPTRLEVWQRGVERFAVDRPYAAALILRHAIELHRSRSGEEPWGEVLAGWEERAGELLEAAGSRPAELSADYPWLALADAASLAACARSPEPFRHPGGRGRWDGQRLLLDPFPLAGATTLTVAARRVADRRYAGDADLGAALATTRWLRLPVAVAPAA